MGLTPALFFRLATVVAVVDGGAAREKRTLRFVTVGDWGVRRGDGRRPSMEAVASSVDRYASEADVGLVIALGDNFLDAGVANASDPQWDASWRRPWINETETSSLKGVPWYAVLGERDYARGAGGAAAQTAREWDASDDEWRLPSRPCYVIKRHLADHAEIAFVFLDTAMFAPAFHATTADLYNASDVAAAMVALDDALRSAGDTARWLVVAGHWPMRSVSDSGGSRALLALLRPLFLARGVDAYVAGHDRALEHVVDGPLHHVVNGNAAAGGGRLDDAYLLGAVGEGVDVALATTSLGFTGHVVSTDAMATTFYDETGAPLHAYEQAPVAKCVEYEASRCPAWPRGVAPLADLAKRPPRRDAAAGAPPNVRWYAAAAAVVLAALGGLHVGGRLERRRVTRQKALEVELRTLVDRRRGARSLSPEPPLPELLDIAPTRPDYGDLDLSPTRAARSLPVTRIDII